AGEVSDAVAGTRDLDRVSTGAGGGNAGEGQGVAGLPGERRSTFGPLETERPSAVRGGAEADCVAWTVGLGSQRVGGGGRIDRQGSEERRVGEGSRDLGR